MPVYKYRREDGTEFEIRQKFNDDPLTADPKTGQPVQRVIQAAGIVFKGSGFYVNDSRGSKASLNGSAASKSTAADVAADKSVSTESAAAD